MKYAKVKDHIFWWWLKCYYSQRNSLGTDRESIVPEIGSTWKRMLYINKKSIFAIKNIYLYNLWYVSALSHFSIEFPWKLIFTCSAAFFNVFHLSVHSQRSTLSQNALTCQFTKNQLHVDFITKWVRCCKLGQLWCITSRESVIIIKWDNSFVLQSWATGITK